MGSDNHFNARQDNNQVFSVIGVQGTHGTADTMGTSKTVPLGIDPTTGAAYVYNLGPAGETTIGDIPGGTIDQISGGSIVVTAGTVTTTIGDLSGGTIDLITALASGSVSVIAGTIGTVGAIAQVHNAGTIAALPNIPGGTIGLISSVASLAAGSIAMTAGTITGALPAGTNAVGKVGHDTTGIGHGVTTVTTAGTDVVLSASQAAKEVFIQAQTDNTGLIAVGASGVDATIATGTGILLYPGDSISMKCDNLNDIYIDATVNGEGVRYTYFT